MTPRARSRRPHLCKAPPGDLLPPLGRPRGHQRFSSSPGARATARARRSSTAGRWDPRGSRRRRCLRRRRPTRRPAAAASRSSRPRPRPAPRATPGRTSRRRRGLLRTAARWPARPPTPPCLAKGATAETIARPWARRRAGARAPMAPRSTVAWRGGGGGASAGGAGLAPAGRALAVRRLAGCVLARRLSSHCSSHCVARCVGCFA